MIPFLYMGDGRCQLVGWFKGGDERRLKEGDPLPPTGGQQTTSNSLVNVVGGEGGMMI